MPVLKTQVFIPQTAEVGLMGESCKCCIQPRSWREIVSARDFKSVLSQESLRSLV
jgi:hypothetical protein